MLKSELKDLINELGLFEFVGLLWGGGGRRVGGQMSLLSDKDNSSSGIPNNFTHYIHRQL